MKYTLRLSLAILLIMVTASRSNVAAAPGVSLSNAFVEALVTKEGSLVMGTTGGDPGTPDDDNKPLLGTYPDESTTSFTSLRIDSQDFSLRDQPPASGPIQVGEAIVTAWRLADIAVDQIHDLAVNPYTGRPDVVRIQYVITNTSQITHQVGARVLLDVTVGDNDGSAYLVPGAGQVQAEREWQAPDIPGDYLAFESPDYAAASLTAQGILTGHSATTPDRFVIAPWAGLDGSVWDYDVTPGTPLGDSATALWWLPRPVGPGQTLTLTTFYGLGPGGSPAATPTAISSPTLTPSATATASPSATPTPTATSTSSSTLTPTDAPTATVTASPSSTPSATSLSSRTPTSTATSTSTPTVTITPSATPSARYTPVATATPTTTAISQEQQIYLPVVLKVDDRMFSALPGRERRE